MAENGWYWRDFHLTVYAPRAALAGGELGDFQGRLCPRLRPELFDPQSSFPVSFEEAYSHLVTLHRMFIEPDGAFVWRGAHAGKDWQIDGVLYDRAGRLLYLEIKGSAPHAVFRQLVAALGGEHQEIPVQDLRTGQLFVVKVAPPLVPNTPSNQG